MVLSQPLGIEFQFTYAPPAHWKMPGVDRVRELPPKFASLYSIPTTVLVARGVGASSASDSARCPCRTFTVPPVAALIASAKDWKHRTSTGESMRFGSAVATQCEAFTV